MPRAWCGYDSTVTDQPGEPTASWGQMFTRFFTPDVAIANHAESGETLKSFITGLRLDKILSQMKKGDYLFIEFGHNDMKVNWPQTYVEPFTTHKQYLKVFIAEARRRGAIPVLVTPMQRRNFDGLKIRNSLGDFPRPSETPPKLSGISGTRPADKSPRATSRLSRRFTSASQLTPIAARHAPRSAGTSVWESSCLMS